VQAREEGGLLYILSNLGERGGKVAHSKLLVNLKELTLTLRSISNK
jgi:hypothetical protein